MINIHTLYTHHINHYNVLQRIIQDKDTVGYDTIKKKAPLKLLSFPWRVTSNCPLWARGWDVWKVTVLLIDRSTWARSPMQEDNGWRSRVQHVILKTMSGIMWIGSIHKNFQLFLQNKDLRIPLNSISSGSGSDFTSKKLICLSQNKVFFLSQRNTTLMLKDIQMIVYSTQHYWCFHVKQDNEGNNGE